MSGSQVHSVGSSNFTAILNALIPARSPRIVVRLHTLKTLSFTYIYVVDSIYYYVIYIYISTLFIDEYMKMKLNNPIEIKLELVYIKYREEKLSGKYYNTHANT